MSKDKHKSVALSTLKLCSKKMVLPELPSPATSWDEMLHRTPRWEINLDAGQTACAPESSIQFSFDADEKVTSEHAGIVLDKIYNALEKANVAVIVRASLRSSRSSIQFMLSHEQEEDLMGFAQKLAELLDEVVLGEDNK